MAACQGQSLPWSLQDLQLTDEIQQMGFLNKLMCASKKGGGEAKGAASWFSIAESSSDESQWIPQHQGEENSLLNGWTTT